MGGFLNPFDSSSGSSSSAAGGFVGAFTTAVVAAGANNNVTPAANPLAWPGTAAQPYGRVDFTGALADFNVSGLAAGLDGQIVVWRNATAFNMTVNDQSAASTAANRVDIGDGTQDVIVGPGSSILSQYYGASTGLNRWVMQR